MKRPLTFLLALVLGFRLFASPITPEKALQVASWVFESDPNATKAQQDSKLSFIWDEEYGDTKSSLEPAFYVVTRETGGFVIVAGDDNVPPVLGFSYENPFSFTDMPANVQWWLEQYKQLVRSNPLTNEQVNELWALFSETKASVGPSDGPFFDEFVDSRTNLWNQTNPSNYYCPDIDGQEFTSVCGCAALAVAEIMAWFGDSNISSASGSAPSYEYTSKNEKNVTINTHALGTVYQWNNLKTLASYPLEYNPDKPYDSDFYRTIVGFENIKNNAELIQKLYTGKDKGNTTLTPIGENLAHLIYDIAVLLQASFNDQNNGGTSALEGNIVKKVAPVMKYNSAARIVKRAGFHSGQWEKILAEEVRRHPVFYTGESDDENGHGYVVDGYAWNQLTNSDRPFFHFNMGWGGKNNGYYLIDIQDEYDRKHSAIFDFYPNANDFELSPRLEFVNGGIEYKDGYKTGTLTFNIKNFINTGNAPFTGEIYAGITDAFGNLTIQDSPLLSIVDPLDVNHGFASYGPFSVTIEKPYPGKRLSLFYKVSGQDEKKPFLYQPVRDDLVELPFYPRPTVVNKGIYVVGDYFEFELYCHHYSYKESVWKICEPNFDTTDYSMDTYRVKLKLPGLYLIEVTIPGQEKVKARFIVVSEN